MAKSKIVSVNKIDTILKTSNCVEKEVYFGEISVKIKPHIKLTEYSQMIKDIALMIIDVNTGDYDYSYHTFAVQYNIIKYFTNISTVNQDKIFELINCTNIMGEIREYISPSVETITEDANEAIEFIKQMAFKSSPWDEVAEKVNDMLISFENTTSVLKNINGDDITKLFELFGSINQEDIKDMALKQLKNNGKN